MIRSLGNARLQPIIERGHGRICIFDTLRQPSQFAIAPGLHGVGLRILEVLTDLQYISNNFSLNRQKIKGPWLVQKKLG